MNNSRLNVQNTTFFKEPEKWQWQQFKTTDGADIRTGYLPCEESDKLLIIAPGLSEFGEKYFGICQYFHDQGYSCAVIDWRGQGLSDRYFKNRHKRHSLNFDLDATHFHEWIRHLTANTNKDIYILAHSMGGHLALRALQLFPDITPKAFATSAPMVDLRLSPVSRHIIKLLYTYGAPLSLADRYAPGQTNWSVARFKLGRKILSQDPDIHQALLDLLTEKPELANGGVTIGWVYHALISCAALQSDTNISRITCPVYIGIAEHEHHVSNTATKQFSSKLATSTLKTYKHAYHEIMMEIPPIREEFLKDVTDFFDKA